MKALEKQLILKGIVAEADWPELSNQIKFDFAVDNHYEEFKNAEVLTNRLNALQQVQPFIGKYYSDYWVKRNVLMQSDEDIDEMSEQMEQEQQLMQPELDQFGQPVDQQGDGMLSQTPGSNTGFPQPNTPVKSRVPNIDGAGR